MGMTNIEYMMLETVLKNTEEILDEVRRSEKTAVWVGIDQEPHEEWECSNCGNIIDTFLQYELEEHKYCHRCGTKMSMPWADIRGEE